jgi:hypothetical protein
MAGVGCSPLLRAAINGSYFCPASKRYPGTASGAVICDRCKAQPLSACIGYEGIDLCLSCANTLVTEDDGRLARTAGPFSYHARPDGIPKMSLAR